jgi:nitroreductase
MNLIEAAPSVARDALPQARVEFFEVLRMRRSVRAFEDRPLEEEKLQRILAAANSAPSAGNLQAYEIVIVRDEALKRALVPAVYNQGFVAEASVVLIFCAHQQRSEAKYGPVGGEFFALQDATIACAYAELAVAALGLGTVWIGALDVPQITRLTGIPSVWKPIALLPIGYRGQSPLPTPRRRLDELVHEINRR